MASKFTVLSLVLALAAFASARSIVGAGPPSADNSALMARYIVNQADWTSIATVSVDDEIKGYPFANLKSISDGAKGEGSGVVYFFLTPLDFSAKDLEANPRTTIMMTLAQGSYCAEKNLNPMDPRCPRVIMSGQVKKIDENEPEYQVAKKAMFARHPWLSFVPADHEFFFAKLDIEKILVLANFGGAAHVTADEYYNAK